MSDQQAIDCFGRGDLAGMFRRLNGLWLVDILQTLDELATTRGFSPSLGALRASLDRAGIGVARMEAALGAVAHKRNRSGWSAFASAFGSQIGTLPPQQRTELQNYMSSFATPGGGSVLLLADVQDRFLASFAEGFSSSLPSSLATDLKSKLLADPIAFMNGYQRGALAGLITGLQGLFGALRDLFKLALVANPLVLPLVVGEAVGRETWLLLTSSTHRKLRMQEYHDAEAVALAVGAALKDIIDRPSDYLALSGDVGFALGAYMGSELAADLASRDPAGLGDLAGRIAGQVAFEIIIQALLLLVTEGVGNAARAAAVTVEGTQGAGRLASLIVRLRPLLSRLPGIERLLVALRGERGAATAIAVGERVILSEAEYAAALRQVFPGQYLDDVARAVDQIGQRAATRAMQNPRFVDAIRSGNWTNAGTFFHSAAAQEARAAAGVIPAGWTVTAEEVVQAGRGGSRTDILLRSPAGQVAEFDWKTTGRSALSTGSRDEMIRHAGHIRTNVGGTQTVQQSVSWVDYVRPLLQAQGISL